jgi:hypothetical protein
MFGTLISLTTFHVHSVGTKYRDLREISYFKYNINVKSDVKVAQHYALYTVL